MLQIQQGCCIRPCTASNSAGWIRASWGTSDNKLVQYYELTKSGRQQLESKRRMGKTHDCRLILETLRRGASCLAIEF